MIKFTCESSLRSRDNPERQRPDASYLWIPVVAKKLFLTRFVMIFSFEVSREAIVLACEANQKQLSTVPVGKLVSKRDNAMKWFGFFMKGAYAHLGWL